MYICNECGNVFDSGEERIYREQSGEVLACCPFCGGGFTEADVCESCGAAYPSQEVGIYEKWCLDCLIAKVNYDVFLSYLLSDVDDYPKDNVGILEQFVMSYLWGIDCGRLPTQSSEELKMELVDIYKKHRDLDIFMHKTDLLDDCREFVKDDPDHFAYWLAKKEVSHGM